MSEKYLLFSNIKLNWFTFFVEWCQKRIEMNLDVLSNAMSVDLGRTGWSSYSYHTHLLILKILNKVNGLVHLRRIWEEKRFKGLIVIGTDVSETLLNFWLNITSFAWLIRSGLKLILHWNQLWSSVKLTMRLKSTENRKISSSKSLQCEYKPFHTYKSKVTKVYPKWTFGGKPAFTI